MSDATKLAMGALKSAQSATRAIAESLDEMRLQIGDLKAARKKLAGLKVAEDVALGRAERWVASVVANAQQAAPSPNDFRSSRDGWQIPRTDADVAFCAYLGDLLLDAVQAQLRESCEDDPGIGETDRKARMSALGRQLLDLELAEEAIIRHAEALGLSVMRRENADPLAVLADDSVLP